MRQVGPRRYHRTSRKRHKLRARGYLPVLFSHNVQVGAHALEIGVQLLCQLLSVSCKTPLWCNRRKPGYSENHEAKTILLKGSLISALRKPGGYWSPFSNKNVATCKYVLVLPQSTFFCHFPFCISDFPHFSLEQRRTIYSESFAGWDCRRCRFYLVTIAFQGFISLQICNCFDQCFWVKIICTPLNTNQRFSCRFGIAVNIGLACSST